MASIYDSNYSIQHMVISTSNPIEEAFTCPLFVLIKQHVSTCPEATTVSCSSCWCMLTEIDILSFQLHPNHHGNAGGKQRFPRALAHYFWWVLFRRTTKYRMITIHDPQLCEHFMGCKAPKKTGTPSPRTSKKRSQATTPRLNRSASQLVRTQEWLSRKARRNIMVRRIE